MSVSGKSTIQAFIKVWLYGFSSYKGKDYLLEKAEVRTPSEHRFSGKKLPLEIQFYHRSSNGLRQAMISLFAVKGIENPWMAKFLDMAEATATYKTSSSGY